MYSGIQNITLLLNHIPLYVFLIEELSKEYLKLISESSFIESSNHSKHQPRNNVSEIPPPPAVAAAKSLQSCPTLCNPVDSSHQAPPSLGFSRQEHWSGLPFPSPLHESEKWKCSRSVISDSSRPHGLQPTRLLHPWDFPGKSTGVGCHCFFHWGLILTNEITLVKLCHSKILRINSSSIHWGYHTDSNHIIGLDEYLNAITNNIWKIRKFYKNGRFESITVMDN